MASRITKIINSGWKFLKLTENEIAIEAVDLDDSGWENVTLPHTWNSEDCCGTEAADECPEHYYRGLGGYRKAYYFSEEEFSEKQIFLEFEGANSAAEAFVNGKSAGVHEGGYSSFRFDITDHIRLGEENIIAVKVSNAPSEYIAPITDQGDFTKMGGIYRDVKLIACNKVHIDLTDFGSSGIFVTPKNISSDNADIDLIIKLANDSSENRTVTVKAEIFNADGKIAASEEIPCNIAANNKLKAKLDLKITSPILWNGTQNPYLYSVGIFLINDENILDEFTVNFGIREYRIDAEKGFFLNGKYIDLHGVNYHQDSYENGWAMTDKQRERDYLMMSDMGCNSVRMAHYQHDSYEYELCDRLGFMVWTEIGIINKMSADETEKLAISDGFAENAKNQLTELIRQNYNHPSVIVWGITNELHQMNDEIYDIFSALNDLAHTEDKTRLTVYADNQFWGKFLEMPTDALGCNRYFGWYKDAGPAEKFGEWLDTYHDKIKAVPLCVSEYGGGGAISQHKDNIDWENEIDPWGGRHFENYQSEMHEKIWAQFSQRKYLWGKFIWCMFDFASAGRKEGDTTGQNDKGLATRNRVRKDSFYFYKSVWGSEPMVHITEKRFEERPSQVPRIKVYSNGEKVELFINGSSIGIVEKSSLDPNYSTVFTWNNISINTNKENIIRAAAYFSDGNNLDDTAVWTGK